MRSTSTLALLAAPAVAFAAINVTETNTVDLDAGAGELGWGASDLAYGYSAGCGLNFSSDLVAGGFNAAVPGQGEGAIGGGYTINDTTVTIGLGGFLGNQSLDIAIVQDRTTGEVTLTVNGNPSSL